MAGCAPIHDAVAAFVAALKDIDGVTRVGLDNSTRAGEAEGSESAAAGSGEGCTGPDKRTSFGLTAVLAATLLGLRMLRRGEEKGIEEGLIPGLEADTEAQAKVGSLR